MKKLLGVIGILALAAALLPAQGYADLRGAFAPITTASGFVNGAEQAAWRPIDADGIMSALNVIGGVDGRECEEWLSITTRSLVPGREGVRSIWLHLNAQQSGYTAPMLNDPAADISYFDPAWSSDGRFLAYIQATADGSSQALYVQEFFVNDDFEADHGGSYDPGEGAESTVGDPILVYSGDNVRHPDWSPTGYTLAFDNNLHGSADVYTADVDVVNGTASAATRRTFVDNKSEATPSWSPNGHEIAYSTNKFGPAVIEIIDLALASGAPGYARGAEVNFASVSHGDPDWSSDGGTIYYDAPSGEDPAGPSTIWSIKLSSQAKCEINFDPHSDADPAVSGVLQHTNDGIPYNYVLYTSQDAAAFFAGPNIWRTNPIWNCQLPLKMGVATVPAVMDINDSTTTVFQTISNFPPETRNAGYRCGGSDIAANPAHVPPIPAQEGVRCRSNILNSPTLLGLNCPTGLGSGPGRVSNTSCFDSIAHGLPDSVRLRCVWGFRRIANRIIALGLVDQIVPMKMQAYGNLTGRTFQGFAYMKLTQSSLPAAGVALLGNSPNPFNPVTKIRFAVSKAGKYTLRLYNVQGALVKTVASQHYDVGTHEASWDGRTTNGGKAASGVYYAKIFGAGKEGSSGIKMVLAK